MVRKTQKAGRRSRHPKKGQMSRTRAGRKDFTTKKSSTKFNRRGHRQSRSARGVKRRPYSPRRRRGGSRPSWYDKTNKTGNH